MADVLVLGGGTCGLGAAMMLARDGHDVTVVERDLTDPPDSAEAAVEEWERPGVAQFRQAHYMHARFRHVVETELPEVLDGLDAAGALRYDPLTELFPPTVTDREPRPGDDRFWTITARRPVLEAVFARAAANQRGVKVMRGTKVDSLITGTEAVPGVPHVIGARTVSGDQLRADVVIDAMGRGSHVPELLQQVSGRPPYEEAEDCGYTYYGRYFRSRDGSLPKPDGALLAAVGSVSVLTLPADNDTWLVVVFMASGDMPLKELRHAEKWTRFVSSLPRQAHWLDGEAITPVESMSGIMDRYRRFVVDGSPVVTGLLPVADAWACTNPSFGRGISLGMWHAQRLRDHLRSADGDPKDAAERWDAITETELTPWYQSQVAMDRARVAEMDAAREGREAPSDDPMGNIVAAFFTSMQYDADMFRAFLEVMACLATPEEILSRPGAFEKMLAASEGNEPFNTPGPTREELLEIVA